jgi:hypothetical protein
MQAPRGSLERTYNLSEVVGLAFRLYALDWRGFVTLGAMLIPLSVAATMAQSLTDDPIVLIPVVFGILVVTIGVSAIVEAAVILHMLDLTAGLGATESLALSRGWARRGDLLRGVYRSFAITLLALPTIVGAFYLAVRWIYVPQAVIIDRQPSRDALSYSAGLVKGSWWRTFGRIIVLGLLIAIATGAITGLATSAPIFLYALVSAIVDAFVSPYFSIALTLTYFDLKARKADTEI